MKKQSPGSVIPLVIVVTVLFACLPSLLYLPTRFSWFFWQRGLGALGHVMMGVFGIPIHTLARFEFADAHWSMRFVVHIGVSLILGLGLGMLAWVFWRLGRLARLFFGILILGNAFIGLAYTLWMDIPVEPAVTCERFFSTTRGVRIIAFPEIGAFSGTWFFYVSTQDGGESWKSFIFSRIDDHREPPCKDIGSLDEQLFWAWTPWDVGVTHDGGDTWNVWHWQCCEHGCDCDHGPVMSVEFYESNHGVMKVSAWHGSTSELTTEDGGQTWTEVIDVAP